MATLMPATLKKDTTMSAGASATSTPTAVMTSHPVDDTLPFQPRTLSIGEATSRELFVFYSPRNTRVVKVCEYLHLALALQLEFDRNVAAYVERPRKINLAPKYAIDISFWVRMKDGQERFVVAIPTIGTVGHAREGAALRNRERMDIAAKRHDIALTYVLEQDLLAVSSALRVNFLLLPHVQSVRRIPSRVALHQGIKAYFAAMPRVSFRTLVAYFSQFTADHVIAVAASMVHEGTLRLDPTRPLTWDSVLEENHVA
jgi:hypothetical protein